MKNIDIKNIDIKLLPTIIIVLLLLYCYPLALNFFIFRYIMGNRSEFFICKYPTF